MEIARGVLELPLEGYTTDARIQEIDLGRWDQLTDDEARALDPAYFDRRANDKWNVPALGGEDYEDVAARLTDWIAEPEDRHLRRQPWRGHPHPAGPVPGAGRGPHVGAGRAAGRGFPGPGHAGHAIAACRRRGFQPRSMG